jgi:hypothetical protein
MIPQIKDCYFIRRVDTSQYLERLDGEQTDCSWTSDLNTAAPFTNEEELSVMSKYICQSLGDPFNSSDLVYVDEFFIENNQYRLIDSHPLNPY